MGIVGAAFARVETKKLRFGGQRQFLLEVSPLVIHRMSCYLRGGQVHWSWLEAAGEATAGGGDDDWWWAADVDYDSDIHGPRPVVLQDNRHGRRARRRRAPPSPRQQPVAATAGLRRAAWDGQATLAHQGAGAGDVGAQARAEVPPAAVSAGSTALTSGGGHVQLSTVPPPTGGTSRQHQQQQQPGAARRDGLGLALGRGVAARRDG